MLSARLASSLCRLDNNSSRSAGGRKWREQRCLFWGALFALLERRDQLLERAARAEAEAEAFSLLIIYHSGRARSAAAAASGSRKLIPSALFAQTTFASIRRAHGIHSLAASALRAQHGDKWIDGDVGEAEKPVEPSASQGQLIGIPLAGRSLGPETRRLEEHSREATYRRGPDRDERFTWRRPDESRPTAAAAAAVQREEESIA